MINAEIKDTEGIVILDEPLRTDSRTIYGYMYTTDDVLIALMSQEVTDSLKKELKRKLGKCKRPRRINIGDRKGEVMQFADYVKENYPSQLARDYDNSQTCYDNRFDDEDEEE